MNDNSNGILAEASIIDWLIQTYEIAWHSPDTSTQLGALLISLNEESIVGINMPVGWYEFSDPEVQTHKYVFMEHAERSAIYHAASLGVPTFGATLVCPWAACHDCARGIVEAGISTVIRHKEAIDRTPERWLESIQFGDQILRRNQVDIIEYSGKLNAQEVLLDKQLWKP